MRWPFPKFVLPRRRCRRDLERGDERTPQKNAPRPSSDGPRGTRGTPAVSSVGKRCGGTSAPGLSFRFASSVSKRFGIFRDAGRSSDLVVARTRRYHKDSRFFVFARVRKNRANVNPARRSEICSLSFSLLIDAGKFF